jgi:hypothetical protein
VLAVATDGPCASTRAGAQLIAVEGKYVEGIQLHPVIVFPRVQRVEIGDAVDAKDNRFAVKTNCLYLFFSADSTIQG